MDYESIMELRNLQAELKRFEKNPRIVFAICVFIEMQRRKEVSIERLREDRYARMALNYIDVEHMTPSLERLREYSDMDLKRRFDSCFRPYFLYWPSASIIQAALSDPRPHLTIEFNFSLQYLPIKVLEREGIEIIIDTRSNDLEHNTTEAALFGLFSYLYPERLFIKADTGRPYQPDFIFYPNDPKIYPINEIRESIHRARHSIVLNTNPLNHGNKSIFDDLMKNQLGKAIVMDSRSRRPMWTEVVLGEGGDHVLLVDKKHLHNAYHGARIDGIRIDFNDMLRKIGYEVPWDVARNLDILRMFFPTSSSSNRMSLLAKAKKFVKLGTIVDMRYVRYDDYPYPQKHGFGSYIADRKVFDKNGAMMGINDESNWDIVKGPQHENSLLKDGEIYITRKSSATRTGIYDEKFYKAKADQYRYYDMDNPNLKVYIYAASVILTVKEGIDPYYVFAYINELNRRDEVVNYAGMYEGNKSRPTCTISYLSQIDVPILSDEEMRIIGRRYKKYYREYLRDVYEISDIQAAMRNLITGDGE